MAQASSQHPALRSLQVRWVVFRDHLWRLIVETVGSCMRYRVTGLAAEAAFFAVLSVPPLIFALAGAVGYVSEQFSPADIAEIRNAIIELASRGLTDEAVRRIITPTLNDVLRGGRFDVISVGFVLALWSGCLLYTSPSPRDRS